MIPAPALWPQRVGSGKQAVHASGAACGELGPHRRAGHRATRWRSRAPGRRQAGTNDAVRSWLASVRVVGLVPSCMGCWAAHGRHCADGQRLPQQGQGGWCWACAQGSGGAGFPGQDVGVPAGNSATASWAWRQLGAVFQGWARAVRYGSAGWRSGGLRVGSIQRRLGQAKGGVSSARQVAHRRSGGEMRGRAGAKRINQGAHGGLRQRTKALALQKQARLADSRATADALRASEIRRWAV